MWLKRLLTWCAFGHNRPKWELLRVDQFKFWPHFRFSKHCKIGQFPFVTFFTKKSNFSQKKRPNEMENQTDNDQILQELACLGTPQLLFRCKPSALDFLRYPTFCDCSRMSILQLQISEHWLVFRAAAFLASWSAPLRASSNLGRPGHATERIRSFVWKRLVFPEKQLQLTTLL